MPLPLLEEKIDPWFAEKQKQLQIMSVKKLSPRRKLFF
jgi:hypothetical protein